MGPADISATLSLRSLAIALRQPHAHPVRFRGPLTGVVLACSDLCALAVAFGAPLCVWAIERPDLAVSLYFRMFPFAGFFLVAYAAVGLYPAIAVHPVEELRRIVTATSTVFPLLGMMLFLSRLAENYSRGVFLCSWLLALFALPLFRVGARRMFAETSWWGYPVLVLNHGSTAHSIIAALRKRPSLGLRPVPLYSDDHHPDSTPEALIDDEELAAAVAQRFGIRHALVAVSDLTARGVNEALQRHANRFPHVLVVPTFAGFSSLWSSTAELGGMLGVEIRQHLLSPGPRAVKAILDYALTLVCGLLAAPLIATLAAAIHATSKGPVFYSQWRVGAEGRPFRAWKFRTMVANADAVLEAYLESDPLLRAEWNRTHKLKNDPRVTRVGRFLRRTSLDEVPQLWNVLRREMSLVGPRPIVEEERVHYGDNFELLVRVHPGITGLWQVSGRSDTSYDERVRLDSYYIRNWSPWLDVYILAHTVRAVLARKGALLTPGKR